MKTRLLQGTVFVRAATHFKQFLTGVGSVRHQLAS